MIDKELIQEFREIVKDEYGEDLSFAEAEEIANGLANYFYLLKKAHVKTLERD
jgi:hypothetical protein